MYSGLSLQNNSELTRLANAIRNKSGGSSKMSVYSMVSNVNSLNISGIDASFINNLDYVSSEYITAVNSSFQNVSDLTALSQTIQTKLGISPTRKLSVAQMAYLLENANINIEDTYRYDFRAVARCCEEGDPSYYDIECTHEGSQVGDTYRVTSPREYNCTPEYISFDNKVKMEIDKIYDSRYMTNQPMYGGYVSFAQGVIEGRIEITGESGDVYQFTFSGYDSNSSTISATIQITLGTTTSSDLMQEIRTDEEEDTSGDSGSGDEGYTYINADIYNCVPLSDGYSQSSDMTGYEAVYDIYYNSEVVSGGSITIGGQSSASFDVNGYPCNISISTECDSYLNYDTGNDVYQITITGTLTVPSVFSGESFSIDNFYVDGVSLRTVVTV